MSEPQAPVSPTRILAQLEETGDLESVITAALDAWPLDEFMIGRGVRTYVGEERQVGTSPGRLILCCVEAYFGHLGGGIEGRAD